LLAIDLARAGEDEPGRLRALPRELEQGAGRFGVGPPAQIRVALALDHARDRGQMDDAIDAVEAVA
jgi:hypothetical protein